MSNDRGYAVDSARLRHELGWESKCTVFAGRGLLRPSDNPAKAATEAKYAAQG